MQVTFHNLPLADATRDSALSGLRISTAGSLQAVNRVRAWQCVHYDRRNTLITVSFRVAKLFTSMVNAELHVVTHGNYVKSLGRGNLKFRGHQNDYEETLTDAVCHSVDSTHVGLTVFTDYVFTGNNWD